MFNDKQGGELLLIQSWSPYHLIIPPQYHNAETLRSFACLDKVFYQRETIYYYQKSLLDFTLFREAYIFYELLLRGCLVRLDRPVIIERWQYLCIPEKTSDFAVSRLLLKYIPKKSPIIPLIFRKTNDFFHLMPLDCLYQFTKGVSVEEFKENMEGLVEIQSLRHLKTEPIMRSTQIRAFYQRLALKENCRQLLMREGYFYYEDLIEFNWQLLAKVPSVSQVKIQRMKEMYADTFGL